jgi:transcription elongation factor GreA
MGFFKTMVTPQDKIPLTKDGLAELKKEYQDLLNLRRPQVVERMSLARKVGDLTEDSEYAQAKQELSFIDGRISELEEVISKAILIDEGHNHCQEVKLGCRVTVKDTTKEHIFHLVGEWEADPAEAKISHQSPLGQSLLGKKIGEKVEVEAPAGKIVYTIVKID